ncbi:MAG: 23S rRNA (uracil(1939)-C(5))-methyltransferase RlmD [bacterium]
MPTTVPLDRIDSQVAQVAPRCRHFGVCGGCLWQDVDYPAQLQTKEAFVTGHLRAVADPAVFRPIIAAPSPWFYRNKMEFTFGPPAALGLHERGRWHRIVDLEECFLQSPESAAIVRDVRAYVTAAGLSCYDPRTRHGLLRSLVIREGRGTGEAMVGIVTTPGPWPGAGAFARMLAGRYPHLASIVRGIAPAETMELAEIEVLSGRAHIVERVAGLRFAVGLTTFFQINTAQTEGMIALVDEFAALNGSSRVVDLYCGVGTFALALARRAGEVIGIDASRRSIEAARENAAANGIGNAAFYAADARALSVMAGAQSPDVLVLDPPRAGAGTKVMGRIAALRPARVIYVSCNPATLGSDLRALAACGYAVAAVQPVDQFPQTPHVECIVHAHREAAA